MTKRKLPPELFDEPSIKKCLFSFGSIKDGSLKAFDSTAPIKAILKFVQYAKNVEDIVFDGRKFSLNEMTELCEGLNQLPKISYLTLKNCGINYELAEILSNFLKTNNTLSELDLSENDISDYGIICLEHSLKTNTELYIINLEKNNIGDSGVLEFSKIIQSNGALRKAYISTDNLTEIGFAAIEKIDEFLEFGNIVSEHSSICESSHDVIYSDEEIIPGTPPELIGGCEISW